jgi:hypothetical protein
MPRLNVVLGCVSMLAVLSACGSASVSTTGEGGKAPADPGGNPAASTGTAGGTGGSTGGSGGSGGSTGGGSGGSGGGSGGSGGSPSTVPDAGTRISPDDFWKDDPPPQWCGPAGGSTPPKAPGGTPECPDDKNRQGCPCTNVGEQVSCYPGLRANRNLGVCTDGVATCQSGGEFGAFWGPCEGYVLPTAGATKGKEACKCFSAGRWELANTSPCFYSNGSGITGAVSTYLDSQGRSQCPRSASNPPKPEPGTSFTTSTLKVDCAGKFKLCYELKAGDADDPKPSDCSMMKVCTEADYTTAGREQKFPDLPAWTSSNVSCVREFASSGGYGEMSVIGKSVTCDAVDDGSGKPLVFNRVQYCALSCNENPTRADCVSCVQGGGGDF